MSGLRLTFIINHVAFFVSHRLPLALGAAQQGFQVNLLSGQAGSKEMEDLATCKLETFPIRHERLCFRSSSVNPFFEAIGLLQLVLKLRKLKPDIVHCASPKGVLYGGIAARMAGVPSLVLAVSGMGYAFTSSEESSFRRRAFSSIYAVLAKLAYGHGNLRVIVQNRDDFLFLHRTGWVEESTIRLISGSGVDISLYKYNSSEKRENVVLFPARVLYDKGIGEFVEAARSIRGTRPEWKFVIAGAAGYDNPSATSRATIEGWVQEGLVVWLGHVENMPQLFMKSSIVCLPSYREGMPKALLEAAAAGCAVVTTDVVGCREAIEPGVTGDLVPAKDANSLASALLGLIDDESRRREYGLNGRKRAEKLFGIDSVVSATLDIYQELLGNAKKGL